MDAVLAVAAALAATAFTTDLGWRARNRRRPHLYAYAAGMGMFAVASWALVAGLVFGWSGAAYRTFFLFGAILNVPFLALGSMFLVAGKRAGHIMFLVCGAIAAISVTLTTTVPLAASLPRGGIPSDVFPPPSEFGPRLLAAITGGAGATILVGLALGSVFRFWKVNRRLVAGNGLIVAGVLAAASGGSFLAFGEGASFALSLLAAVSLIWWGYRVATGHSP
jgi:hypothetical protein